MLFQSNVGTLNVATVSNLQSLSLSTASIGSMNVATTANIANIYTTNIVGFVGSQWTSGAGNVYYLSNVGIGTSVVSANLQVAGNIYASNAVQTPSLITTTADVGTLNVATISNLQSLSVPTANITTLNATSVFTPAANIGALNVATISNLLCLTALSVISAPTANVGTLRSEEHTSEL